MVSTVGTGVGCAGVRLRQSEQLPDRAKQTVGLAGFRQMHVATRAQGAHLLVVHGSAAERDDGDVSGVLVVLQAARHFPTVDVGQSQIEHDEIGTRRLRKCQRVDAAVEGVHAKAFRREIHLVSLARVLVVVDEHEVLV